MKEYSVDIGFSGKFCTEVKAENEEEAEEKAKDLFFEESSGDLDIDIDDIEVY